MHHRFDFQRADRRASRGPRFSLIFPLISAAFSLACGSAPSEDAFATPDDVGTGADSRPGGDSSATTDSGAGIDTLGGPDVPPEDHAPPPPPPGDQCVTAIDLTPTATPQSTTGDSSLSRSHAGTFSCGTAKGPDIFFKINHPGGDLWLDTQGSTYGTLLELRSECSNPTSVRACSDKTSDRPDSSRIVYRGLEAGTYFLVLAANGSDGGAYRLTYAATGFPAQSTCTTAEMLISDVLDPSGKARPLGADVWDAAESGSMTSNVELRPGPTGGDTCISATGRKVFGQGPDQIYHLRFGSERKLKITAFAVNPSAFAGGPPGTFDLLAYLRNAEGPPHSDPTTNCEDSKSTTSSDTCVAFGTETTVPAGNWFLVFDSVGTSNGKYHMQVLVH